MASILRKTSKGGQFKSLKLSTQRGAVQLPGKYSTLFDSFERGGHKKPIISLARIHLTLGRISSSGERQMANQAWIGQPTTKNTTATIRSGLAYYVDSPADRFVEAIEEEPDAHVRMVLATRALRHDPGCIEARLEMAAYLEDGDARMAHLSKAIETGEHLWQPVIESRSGDPAWWAVSATRPYMRAIHSMGVLHKENGELRTLAYASSNCSR